VQTETRSTLSVVRLLRKVEQKKMYLSLGFGSLLEFCMKDLKYSESAANRRVSAMWALKDIPELEGKIQTGKMNLSLIVQARTHIRQKEKQTQVKVNKNDKKSLFESLEGLSCRQAEKELVRQNPEVITRTESIRQVTEDLQQLKLILTAEMQQDLEKLKSLLSHKMPGASIGEILHFAIKECLHKRDPERAVRTKRSSAPVAHKDKDDGPGKGDNCTQGKSHDLGRMDLMQIYSGRETKVSLDGLCLSYPIALKREVWKKHQGRCCFQFKGQRCGSKFQLEIDHIIPIAKGGTNHLANLQLLCRRHNQMKGIKLKAESDLCNRP